MLQWEVLGLNDNEWTAGLSSDQLGVMKPYDAVWVDKQPVRPRTAEGVGELALHATSWQTPPAARMRFSAILENILARTMQGTLGISPFPRTLMKPYENRSTFII